MYTDPTHIKISDPGHIEGNVVFTYLDAFCKDEHFKKYLNEYKNLDELKEHYKLGGLGDMKIKKFLNQVLEEILFPIREKRKEYAKNIPYILDILRKGNKIANEAADKTLKEVKNAMGISYFDDQFLNEQKEKYEN